MDKPTAKHTTTPWKVGDETRIGAGKSVHHVIPIISLGIAENGIPYEVCGPVAYIPAGSKEWAELIVRAVNAHEELLSALKELREAVKGILVMNHTKYDALGIKVNEAIAKAERR